ncbi:MAG: dihydroorotate dehydrogenase electron transfer subunit [Lachnospiraceae bacterium]|nr:dihydroorotate dehydrogenase electron transfer subunit [Lachnospiraceae bacterium]
MKTVSIRKRSRIIEKELLAPDIYRMSFETELCGEAEPGQFVLVYPPGGSRLLGRPLCIADVSAAGNKRKLTIVFRTVGGGTREIADCAAGDELYIEGPLGHGYPLDEGTVKDKDIVLLGGGLGAPSLLFLAKLLAGKAGILDKAGQAYDIERIAVVLGYRDSSLKHFLADDFKALGIKTLIATDDGSEGLKGNVLQAMEGAGLTAGLIYACGPMPMLSAVKKYSTQKKIPAYVSLEEHMACGVGVCLGCVVRTSEKDAHSNVNNARVCTEGPVFDIQKVEI